MFDEFGPHGAEEEREELWTDLSEVPDEQYNEDDPAVCPASPFTVRQRQTRPSSGCASRGHLPPHRGKALHFLIHQKAEPDLGGQAPARR